MSIRSATLALVLLTCVGVAAANPPARPGIVARARAVWSGFRERRAARRELRRFVNEHPKYGRIHDAPLSSSHFRALFGAQAFNGLFLSLGVALAFGRSDRPMWMPVAAVAVMVATQVGILWDARNERRAETVRQIEYDNAAPPALLQRLKLLR